MKLRTFSYLAVLLLTLSSSVRAWNTATAPGLLFSVTSSLNIDGLQYPKGAIYGQIAALGDPQEARVLVFENSTASNGGNNNGGSNYQQTAVLQAQSLPTGQNATASEFGYAVRLHSTEIISTSTGFVNITDAVMAVGAPGLQNNAGSVFIFRRVSSTVWNQEARIQGSNVVAGARFGQSLSFSLDNTLVVGAPGDGNGLPGNAYVFKFANGAWTQVAAVQGSGSAAGDLFGWSVSMANQDLFMVGAPGNGAGAAYVFGATTAGSNNYTELASLAPPRSTVRFGRAVGMSSSIAVVMSSPGVATDFDQIHIYSINKGGANKWGYVQSLDIDTQRAGLTEEESLSVVGNVIAVGMPFFNQTRTNTGNQGGVLVFTTNTAAGVDPNFVKATLLVPGNGGNNGNTCTSSSGSNSNGNNGCVQAFGYTVQLSRVDPSVMIVTSANGAFILQTPEGNQVSETLITTHTETIVGAPGTTVVVETVNTQQSGADLKTVSLSLLALLGAAVAAM